MLIYAKRTSRDDLDEFDIGVTADNCFMPVSSLNCWICNPF